MIQGQLALESPSDATLGYRPPKAASRTSIGKVGAPFSFYEFFCGGGMARAGLGPKWQCLFANDFDFKKSACYVDNWGSGVLKTKDVGKIDVSELTGRPSLAWASFPCQDLSLAGMGAGLRGDRSGTFWPFWRLMTELRARRRPPPMIVLENVCGTLTSHEGKDFVAIANALSAAKYRFGALIVDAAEFVPQSRPRLFIIAASSSTSIPDNLVQEMPSLPRHTLAVQTAYELLSAQARKNWIWWKTPTPPKRTTCFRDLIEDDPTDVEWHTPQETAKLLAMMSPLNLKKVAAAKKSGQYLVGTVYKRTRVELDEKKQRAEVRFDSIAGCLRTPAGGSSRQSIIVVNGNNVRSRLISSRETARLMGLPETYKLPNNYNEAYHLTGDGVCVPVVRYLADSLFEPILKSRIAKARASR